MQEIQKLIEAAKEVIATRDVFADSQLARLAETKNAAEAMLKRAKCFEGKVHRDDSEELLFTAELGGYRDFTWLLTPTAMECYEGKRVRIIVVPESDDAH